MVILYRQKSIIMEIHRTLIYEGKEIHYRVEGRDFQDTIVLLHGFLQNLDVWTPYTLKYMRKMRVVTIDLPGHGYSQTYGDCHTMEFMAQAVRAVLDEINVDQCVMVGHSMGGYVALAFADMYPYNLRGLGLIHSHAFADTPEKKSLRAELCNHVMENKPNFVVEFIPELFCSLSRQKMAQDIKDLQDQCLETTTEGIVAALNGMAARKSYVSVLDALNVPILFIVGKQDPRLSVELAVSQALIPKYSEIMVLDNVAHMAPWEEREYVQTRLFNFVKTCFYTDL